MKKTLTLTVVMLTFLFNSSISSAAGLKDIIDEYLQRVKAACVFNQEMTEEDIKVIYDQTLEAVKETNPEGFDNLTTLQSEIDGFTAERNKSYQLTLNIIGKSLSNKDKLDFNQKMSDLDQTYCGRKQYIVDLEEAAEEEILYEVERHQILLNTLPLIEKSSHENASEAKRLLEHANNLYDQLLLRQKEYRGIIQETINMQY